MPGIDEHSHGGNLRALGLESGRDPGAILDFSANLNPLGPPPWLRPAVERGLARVAAYPDPDATADILTGLLRASYGGWGGWWAGVRQLARGVRRKKR